jgi:glycosyltransferase involved in cell wall biosynthesis
MWSWAKGFELPPWLLLLIFRRTGIYRVMTSPKAKICFVVAPSGQKGGGMGRVKDYILQSGGDYLGRVQFRFLDTRGSGHVIWSPLYLTRAITRIWLAAAIGELAAVHVNFGDRASALRKGIVILMTRAVGAPAILHLHAVELVKHYEKAGPLLRWLIRRPFRAATCNIVLGQIWKNWLVNSLGVEPARVEVVYNGVPAPGHFRAPESFSTPGLCQILFLGNLMERKGVSDLLHALALLPATAPGWHMTFVGGGDVEVYKTLAEQLRLVGGVTFAGWKNQDEVRLLLATTDALVLPSYEEGLPLAILEALGCGAPVLATPVGAIPEVLQDGNTALLVPPGDREALSEKLWLLISDTSLRKRLSDEGVRLYREKFTLDAFIERLFDVYRRHCGLPIERATS